MLVYTYTLVQCNERTVCCACVVVCWNHVSFALRDQVRELHSSQCGTFGLLRQRRRSCLKAVSIYSCFRRVVRWDEWRAAGKLSGRHRNQSESAICDNASKQVHCVSWSTSLSFPRKPAMHHSVSNEKVCWICLWSLQLIIMQSLISHQQAKGAAVLFCFYFWARKFDFLSAK